MFKGGTRGDQIFELIVAVFAALILVIVVSMIVMMAFNSIPSIREFGVSFLYGYEWKPASGVYGALPFIFGTTVSSLIALVIAVPVSLGIAVFLVEQAPKSIATPVSFMVELLAAIPSVVFGLWGIFVSGSIHTLLPRSVFAVHPWIHKYFPRTTNLVGECLLLELSWH